MGYFMNITYLTLAGHVDLHNYRHAYFFLTFTVYVFIICLNGSVVFVIVSNRRLHEPMYIFIAALLCNALFGATVLYPKLLIDLLSENQIITYHACLLQAYLIYTYVASEFTLLSAMAYDRYVSICKPLMYATILRTYTIKKLLFLSWLLPYCELGIGLIIIYQIQLCKFRLNRIYCDSYSIVKLGCNSTLAMNLYGLFIFSIALFPPVFFIIFSYFRILTVCLKNSKAFRKKALQTCLPHLLIVIIFSISISFEVINNRLESNQIPHIVAIILSVKFLVIPPLFNPIIYGLKLKDIFINVKKLFLCKKRCQENLRY